MIDGVVNLRDLGGVTTREGRHLRTGVVYRSGHLGGLSLGEEEPDEHGRAEPTPVDLEGFERTGIGTVFDLRTDDEVTRFPDRVPPHVEVVHLDVLADATESIATHLAEIFADPTRATRVFDDGVIDRHYTQTYRNLVLLDSARTAYAEMFGKLVAAEHPVLFHCTAGKDRTGWAAASLLTLLGVDRDTVLEDYLRSNGPVLEAFAPYLQQFADMGGDPTVLEPAFLVTPAYLQAAFEAVDAHFGTIERYFDDALGLGVDQQQQLAERLL